MTKRCDCGDCQPCRNRAANRRYYERSAEAVRQRVAARIQAKRETGERYWQDAETKAQKRYRAAMEAGKAPTKGRFALHDGHVAAWTVAAQRVEQRKFALHDAHVKRWRKARPADAYRHLYRADPEFNAGEKLRARLRKLNTLDGKIAAYLANEIKRAPMRKEWEELLGYTTADLVRHLRRTLPRKAKWDDFMAGTLHIDHIIPRAKFDLTREDEVRACWSLSNLQLLPAVENGRKGAKVETLL